jgi:hypothetical protein
MYIYVRVQSYLTGGPCRTGHLGCAPSYPRSRTRPIGMAPSGRMTLPDERERGREEELVRKKTRSISTAPSGSYDATWCTYVCMYYTYVCVYI